MSKIWKSNSTSGRPLTGHHSIRGRISGPIPISSSTGEFPVRNPAPDAAAVTTDEEFSTRNAGAGTDAGTDAGMASMTPLPEETDTELQHHQQEPQERRISPTAGTSAAADSVAAPDATQGAIMEPPSHPPPAPPSGSPPRATRTSPQRRSPPARRTNPPLSTVRYSTVSEAPTGHSKLSKEGGPQRKKSTLRAAFGKLFGRKKKSGGSQGSSLSGPASGMLAASQHRSDTSALSRSKEGEAKRSASLPITEYDRALRSHSIGPQELTAIEGVRSSLQGDAGPSRKRAATSSTSRLFTHPRRDSEWGGLTPRPASTHGRGSRLIPGEEDPSEIGRAITSDSGGGNRRRSRSLSGLSDLAGGRSGQRRRSDEIRYWRESYNLGPLSPLSSNAPETDAGNDDTGGVDVSAPESPVADRPPKTPPQPFNFGSLSHEMAGMKITQAASLDGRIGGLEARMFKLERVVTQLCHAVPGFKAPVIENSRPGDSPFNSGVTSDPSSFAYTTAAPPMIPAIYQTMSNARTTSSRYSSPRQSIETDGHSHLSFGEAQTFIGSLYPPSSSATHAQSLTATAPPPVSSANRPASNSTVRGAASLPTMGRETGDGSGGDGTSELLKQIEAERVARQALEAKVKKLSDRLNSLSTTMYALVRDPAKSRSQEHLQLPPSPQPKSAAAAGPPPVPALKSLKTPSVFEADDDSDADKSGLRRGGGDADDDDFSDDFQTPREEHSRPHYGAFGEELRDDEDDPKRKKAARTLSLSQLTLGKGAQLQI